MLSCGLLVALRAKVLRERVERVAGGVLAAKVRVGVVTALEGAVPRAARSAPAVTIANHSMSPSVGLDAFA